MKAFPRSDEREAQYEACGQIIGEIATDIGIPLGDALTERWRSTLGLLATADEMTDDPARTLTPTGLLKIVELPTDNLDLRRSAKGLLVADARSRNAVHLPTHLRSRADEAHHAFGLLHHQSGLLAQYYPGAWDQLYKLTRAGQYLDCLYDAREDAEDLPFSAGQLARGSLRLGVQAARAVEARTWRAASTAAWRNGVVTGFMFKPLRMMIDHQLEAMRPESEPNAEAV